MDRSTPGFAGIVGLMAALGVACLSISIVSGTLFQWLIAGLACVTGVWAVKAINR